jgi:hypothetical protein
MTDRRVIAHDPHVIDAVDQRNRGTLVDSIPVFAGKHQFIGGAEKSTQRTL